MVTMFETSENGANGGGGSSSRIAPVVVGLGGNVGDVRSTFRAALAAMQNRSPFVRISSLFRSAPIGPRQPDFLNAAVLLDWPEPLDTLHACTQAWERAAGRVRQGRWGPRTLDLDILWAAGRVSATSALSVPHLRLTERRFALAPLLELVPDAVDPRTGATLSATLAALENQDVTWVAKSPW